RGTIRFRRTDEVEVGVAGQRLIVPAIARIVGGPLEQALLTMEPAAFVALARPALEAELEATREATHAAAARIDAILDARVHRPLYDARGLRRLVQRAI